MNRAILRYHLTFLAALSLVTTSSAIVSYECPRVNQTTQVQPSQTVRLPRAPSDQLCTLSEVHDSRWIPVARSYDGYDWENVAGPHSTISITCTQMYCDIQVPTAGFPSALFILSSFDHRLPSIDIVARFLEQTTFGTTRTDLETMRLQSNDYGNLPRAFANWVSNQIYNVNKTSHREYWRSRMASRQIYGGHEGGPTHPCQAKSQWRRASFTDKDSDQIVQTANINGRFPLYVNGQLRTVVDQSFFQFNRTQYNITSSMNFTLCPIMDDFVGGSLSIKLSQSRYCLTVKQGNPPISFTSSDPQPSLVVPLPDMLSGSVVVSRRINTTPENIYLLNTLSADICSSIPQMICCNGQGPVYGIMSDGQYMIFDPRLTFRQNTVESPLIDGGGGAMLATDNTAQCANAPRTFLNENYCFLSNKTASCRASNQPDGSFVLNDSSVISFFHATSRQLYIYIIDGLRIEDDASVFPPCTAGKLSRWRRQQGVKCNANIQPDTTALFQQLISQSSDVNPIIRDITLPSQSTCNTLDMKRKNIKVPVGSDCWITTHPENLNVYDFTYWTLDGTHPGNTALTNPIAQFALDGSSTLIYPENHSMYRWNVNKVIFKMIGRYSDTIAFSDLPDHLRQNYVATFLGLTTGSTSGTIVCGSPGEIANKVESYPAFDITRSPEKDTTTRKDFIQQRKTVWTMVVLQSRDQLRQRMAWALSQLLAISPLNDPNTEIYLNYYDIFVRNAFSNYRDILREVVYSPLMAKMLTYLNSQSQAYTWASVHVLKYADENFAREVMQLFTIGLSRLNGDGTMTLDEDGNNIRMYTNDDIMEYSRVFTGFMRQQARGNYEERLGLSNNLDPLTINIKWRDVFPKMGINNQYVGDRYMLCSDLPTRPFLRKGAVYRLLGSSFIPESSTYQVIARGFQSLKVFELEQSSPLYRKLCGGGNCTAALSVILDSNLSCFGKECLIDMIQVVKLTGNLYYEYVRPACVHFPIFNSGIVTMNAKSSSPQCVDGRQDAAAELCCSSTGAVYNTCMFSGERVTSATARARCNAKNLNLCRAIPVPFPGGSCWNYNGNFFLNSTCSVSILVSPEGKIAIEGNNATDEFLEDKNTFFRVSWLDRTFPSIELNSCGSGVCAAVGRLCRCITSVIDDAVFSSIPSRDQALSLLFVGAVPPNMFDNGTYSLRQITSDGIRVYQSSGKNIDSSTIFQVQDDFGRTLLLRNFQSIVYVKSSNGFFASSNYGFRNPPSFFGPVPNKGDAMYETEAALDHFFYNRNTAPFLAMKFIQKFGISNPTPRYIKAVSSAFQRGFYTFEDVDHSLINFGSNMFGDLSATIAAIILDRESRSVVLDSDPDQGSLREPLLKIVALMRNLELKTSSSLDFIILESLDKKIGQMAHDIPSVFSFFLPDYSPPSLSHANLLSPESMLLTHCTGLMNGMISLIKFGLISSFDGFGPETPLPENRPTLSYSPRNPNSPSNVVDELSTLLTSGRMSKKNRNIITEAYSSAKDGLRVAEQLIVSAPEFHSTGLVTSTGTEHKVESVATTCKAYKAIVHILLKGGSDSFNMLVPHSNCATDLYGQYQSIRGSVALAKETLLPIESGENRQPCSVFGLHPSLSTLQTLYNEGSTLFFSNVGGLDRPVTRENYLDLTTTQIFAHDAMQSEIGKLDPFSTSMGTAVLGRLVDYLYERDFNINSFSVDASLSNFAGYDHIRAKYPVQSSEGFRTFDPSSGPSSLVNQTMRLNDESTIASSVFSKLWSEALTSSISISNELYWAQERGSVSTEFPTSDVGNQLKLVAEMINSHDCRKSDRDIFYVEIPGYDHHSMVLNLLESKFDELNAGLSAFITEMKLHNKFQNVVLVSSSDFGRNEGTDHAWGGHTFIVGGSVKGKRILGQYPSDLSDDNPLSVGRGRFIPTMPWEAIWNAVIEWFDVNDDAALNKILPNRQTFSSILLHKNEIFDDLVPKSPPCSRRLSSTGCSPTSSTSSGSGDDASASSATTDGSKGSSKNHSNPHAKKIAVASWLIPVLLLILGLGTAGFLRRRHKKNPSSTCCLARRSHRQSLSEPNVIFFNAIDPNNVETEKGKTINIFEERDDYWAGYS